MSINGIHCFRPKRLIGKLFIGIDEQLFLLVIDAETIQFTSSYIYGCGSIFPEERLKTILHVRLDILCKE